MYQVYIDGIVPTKTISLSEDAYKMLKNLKKENESFTDLVKRLCSGVKLKDFHGALEEESVEEIEKTTRKKRKEHRENHTDRIDGLKEVKN